MYFSGDKFRQNDMTHAVLDTVYVELLFMMCNYLLQEGLEEYITACVHVFQFSYGILYLCNWTDGQVVLCGSEFWYVYHIKTPTTQGLGNMSRAETLYNSCVRMSTVAFLKLHTTDLDEI
jgi:hypothetical protein